MTAFLNDVDFEMARLVLQGYCWDDAHRRIWRVFHFAGTNPNQPKGLTKRSNINGIPPEPDPNSLGLPNAEPAPVPGQRFVDPEWEELDAVLKKYVILVGHGSRCTFANFPRRQSYIVTTRHLLDKDRDFGNAEPTNPNHFNVKPGVLFWSQIPDPASVAGGQSLVLQRKKIELHDQLNLHTVLLENEFRLKTESIEESYDIYHREAPVEFHLVRYHKLPPQADGPDPKQPATTLPPFESLETRDPAGKWILWVSTYVFEDQSPDKIKEARDTLLKVRDDLNASGIQFRNIDRRFLDTQLVPTRQPETQTLGMSQSIAGITGAAR